MEEIYISDYELESIGYEWDTVNNTLSIDGEVIYKILRATPGGIYVMEVTHETR